MTRRSQRNSLASRKHVTRAQNVLRAREEAKRADERLRFAVRFADMEVKAALQGEWVNFLADLDATGGFPNGGGELAATGGMVVLATPSTLFLTEREIVSLQGEVRDLFSALADTQEGKPPARTTPVALSVSKRLAAHPRTGRAYVVVEGCPRDVFLEMVLHLVSLRGLDRIRRCPDCGRLFLRERKLQEYCTRKCTNHALWARYSPEEKREWRQKQYEKNGWTVGGRSRRKKR